MKVIRLDKYVSVACGISRNDAKDKIRKGLVMVNSSVVKAIDKKVSEDDLIEVDGSSVSYKEFVYLILNKPSGIISASNDKRAKTVIDLVPKKFKHYDLFPVGRLDKDTTGLLLITNDGDFAHKVISPKSNIEKLYRVTLDDVLKDEHVKAFTNGIILADKTKCLPANLKIIGEREALVIIMEGKYHQIKRMFGTLNLGVVTLRRLSIGKLTLPDDLKEGDCRELSASELSKIM